MMALLFFLIFFFLSATLKTIAEKQDVDNYQVVIVSQRQPFKLTCRRKRSVIFWIRPPPFQSGGFGDRLRGLVTTFYHALLSNSTFSVDWRTPYYLGKYFHLRNCRRHPRNHNLRQTVDTPYYDNGIYLQDLRKRIRITSNSNAWASVIRNPLFHHHASRLGIDHDYSSELFRIAFDSIIVSPTAILKKAMDEHLNEMNHTKYLGVQLRIGGSQFWEDPDRDSFDSIPCFAKEAIRLCSLASLGTVFVTGDNQEAIDQFKAIFPLLWNMSNSDKPIPLIFENFGTIAHTDRSKVSRTNSQNVWLKSLLDWWLLRHASALVISRSGFGETAAWSSHSLLPSPKLGIPLARTHLHECTFQNTMFDPQDALYFGKDRYQIPAHRTGQLPAPRGNEERERSKERSIEEWDKETE
jgi:hypothetical protein